MEHGCAVLCGVDGEQGGGSGWTVSRAAAAGGRAAAARYAVPASPARAAAREDEVVVAKRLSVERSWTSVADYARTAGAVGSLADLSADHPFVCRQTSQLHANGPTPGPPKAHAAPPPIEQAAQASPEPASPAP
eukprot:361221-Chlamydomonas_euryale.AAC.6